VSPAEAKETIVGRCRPTGWRQAIQWVTDILSSQVHTSD
jgi:hypothetical protein